MKGLIKKILRKELIKEEKVVNFDSPNNNFVVIAGGPGAGKSFIDNKELIDLSDRPSDNIEKIK